MNAFAKRECQEMTFSACSTSDTENKGFEYSDVIEKKSRISPQYFCRSSSTWWLNLELSSCSKSQTELAMLYLLYGS